MNEEANTGNSRQIAIHVYRQELKDKGIFLYEKIFAHVKRFFKDTKEFLLTDKVKYINNSSLAMTTRVSLYTKFYNLYLSNLSDSSFYFFTTDMCTELHSLMNGFLRAYKVTDSETGDEYNLYDLVRTLGFTSWVEKFETTLNTNPVLVSSPTVGIDTNIWSNSNPVGFMFRELSDPNYFYDHSAFYDLFEMIFNESGIEYNPDTSKEIYDERVKSWFKLEHTGVLADKFTEIISELYIEPENSKKYRVLKENITNEIALAVLSYIDFEFTKYFIVKENVLPLIVDMESPITVVDVTDRQNIYEYKTNIDSFLTTMGDMMNVCRSDLIAYTEEQINTFNDMV